MCVLLPSYTDMIVKLLHIFERTTITCNLLISSCRNVMPRIAEFLKLLLPNARSPRFTLLHAWQRQSLRWSLYSTMLWFPALHPKLYTSLNVGFTAPCCAEVIAKFTYGNSNFCDILWMLIFYCTVNVWLHCSVLCRAHLWIYFRYLFLKLLLYTYAPLLWCYLPSFSCV